MQIFVKISSATKVENLPFSEKSAELATLLFLFFSQGYTTDAYHWIFLGKCQKVVERAKIAKAKTNFFD